MLLDNAFLVQVVQMNPESIKKDPDAVDFIDFYDIWRVLIHHKYFFVAFLTVVGVIAVFLVSKMTPTYVATATLVLEEQNSNGLNFNSIFDVGMKSDELVVTEIEVLRSRNMVSQVVEELGLLTHPDYLKAMHKKGMGQVLSEMLPFVKASDPKILPKESDQYRIIGMFDSSLTIKAIPQTRMITVSFESSSPVLAKDAANALAEIYIKRTAQVFRDSAEREAQWLDERLDNSRKELLTLEQTLADFLDSNDLVVIDGVSGLSATKIKQLKSQVLKEQQRNLELASINTLVGRAGLDNLLSLLSVDYVTKNQTIQMLRQTEMRAQQKVNELGTVYGSKHPKMISGQGELTEAKKNLLNELKVIADNTNTNLSTSDEVLDELQGKLDLALQEHQRNQQLENQFIRLTREIDSNRQMYENLLEQSLRNRLTTASHIGFARMVDLAFEPPFPTKPKKKLLVGMSIVLAAAVAATIILIMDAMMNDSFRSAYDVQKHLRTVLLGITPRLKKNQLDLAFGIENSKDL